MHKSVQRPLLWFKVSMSFSVPLYSDLISNKKHVLGSRQDKRWGFTRTNKTNNNKIKSNNRKKILEFCTCKHHTSTESKNQKEIIQSFTLVQRETELQHTVSSKNKSKNKENTIIIIMLQSTTKLKYITGNGCYHI